MKETYPGISADITDWKGQDIIEFQEELRQKVKDQISEKWFYTHIKSNNQTLPRIDILNMLSRYCGYLNWDDFVYRQGKTQDNLIKVNSANRYFVFVPLIVIGILLLFLAFYRISSYREYHFGFFDSVTKQPILGSKTEMIILSEKESPQSYLSDENGQIVIKTATRSLKMVIKTPYYKPDTIKRILRTFDKNQIISLQPDEYSRLIKYMTEMNVNDWTRRQALLDSIFDDETMIYKIGAGKQEIGIELLNKKEFINMLSLPSFGLRNLEILETKMRKDKIYILRFRTFEKGK